MKAEDWTHWLRLRCALWPSCTAQQHAAEMERLAASPANAVVLVAESDGGLVSGFVELSIRDDFVNGASAVRTPYMEGWYVDAPVQRRGIGRQLLRAAEAWAASRGFHELASDAALHNDTGIRAHLASGFTEACRSVHFIKRIATDR